MTSNLNHVKRQPIKVTLSDGKERDIVFTLNAMAELDEKYGSVEKAFEVLEKGSISAIRFILWATIQPLEGEELTERQIGNLIDMQTIGSIMEAMKQASSTDLVQEADVAGTSGTIKVVGTIDPNL